VPKSRHTQVDDMASQECRTNLDEESGAVEGDPWGLT
jgi:hypothetical protein